MKKKAKSSGSDTELGRLTRRRAGASSWAKQRWHNFGANPYPPRRQDFEQDLRAVIRELIVPGNAPPAPMLAAGDDLITLGSCFARELRDYLAELGFSSRNFWIPSGLNNTFAILDFVSWCVTGQETGRGFRYDRTAEGSIDDWKPEADRKSYLDGIRQAGGFVFTIGLAEVWEDRETGSVFWKGVPEEVFDAERHAFRLSSVEENEASIVRIVELIRSVNPQATIVLTLSPVPLKATFRDVSCVVADCVSKSVLRVALDLVMSRQLEGVYYWPSFEVVRWAGGHRPEPSYGLEDNNSRHVNRQLVAEIIAAFVESFYVPEAVAQMQATKVASAGGAEGG